MSNFKIVLNKNQTNDLKHQIYYFCSRRFLFYRFAIFNSTYVFTQPFRYGQDAKYFFLIDWLSYQG